MAHASNGTAQPEEGGSVHLPLVLGSIESTAESPRIGGRPPLFAADLVRTLDVTAEHCAGVGDLVRDIERSRVGVLTDVRGGTPILRPQYGGVIDMEWPAQWAAVELIARRGTWGTE